MKTESYGRKRHWSGSFPPLAAMCIAALLLLAALTWARPSQAAPLAGTSIGNQASATYTDASAVTRTATSNTVQTIVQQVAGLTLTATQTRTGAPGGTIYFPHTLTNTGNGSDTFTFATSAGTSFTFANIVIYADANSDGSPDNFTPITGSGPLAAGTSFKFIVAATIPPIATSGTSNTVTVTATSAFTAGSSASNTDTADVSGNAIIAMTKAVSPGSGNAGSTLTYTLTYTNTGNATATNLKITDVIPTGLTYKSGSGLWSVTGSTSLTDASGDSQGTSPNTIDYDATTTSGTIVATIGQVAPGETRTLTFQVTVNASATPGVINNSAHFTYNDDNNDTTPDKSSDTNTTPFTVNQTAGVVANGSSTTKGATDGESDNLTLGAVPQGSTVSFPVYIWNTGNGTDSIDISVANTSFPAGTSFVLYKSDGVTPLIDTNGNSTPDTGPLGPGASYKVVVKAILPAGVTSATAVSATLTATSKLDSTVSEPAPLVLSGILANTADLTLNTARSDSTPAGAADTGNAATTGFGPGPGSSAVDTISANPGTTAVFTLKVNNTSSTADTYDMAASTVNNFTSTTLPAGWTVTFKADGGSGNCSTQGAVITNTGVINSLHNATVCAVVSLPSNATAGAQNIYFRALSPSSSASDPILCAVSVNTIRSLSVTNNQTGQVFPGGTVVYQMTVTNNGNVTEGTVIASDTPNGSTNSKVLLSISDSLAAQGWTSVVYYDKNGNGAIDATDPVVTDIASSISASGITPGQSFPLLVKVFAPAGAATGVTDVATLTATVTGVINTIAAPAPSSATDTSTVISGQVTLVKTQALDATCAGATSGTTYSQANITSGAIPGACILYKITATNVGTAAVSDLIISDATPANTLYNAGTNCKTTTSGGAHPAAVSPLALGTITPAPTECTATTISATIPTLNPGASVDVTFGVQINQ